MDIKKFLQIILKDVQSLFADPPTLMIMYAAPLTLTFILAAAFGNISTGGAPIRDIPIVVVNQDSGGLFGNFGEELTRFLVEPPAGLLEDMLAAREIDDPDEARQIVRRGRASAAIIIPPDFSQSLNASSPDFGTQKIRVEVFRNAAAPLGAEITTGVVRQMVNTFASANIAAASAVRADPALLLQVAAIAESVAEQSSSTPPIRVSTEQGQATQGPGFNLLQYFAPAMSVFFLNFTMAFGVLSVIEEREKWTLQRMLISPTSRLTILAGKLGAAYVNGVIQLVILIASTSLFAPIFGSSAPVWGTDLLALAIMVLMVVAASIGLGTIIVGLAKDRQQAAVFANAILILMGIAGGTFFGATSGPPLGAVSYLTLNWWATEGFLKLAQGTFAVTNVIALGLIFVMCFGAGVVLFNRRVEV